MANPISNAPKSSVQQSTGLIWEIPDLLEHISSFLTIKEFAQLQRVSKQSEQVKKIALSLYNSQLEKLTVEKQSDFIFRVIRFIRNSEESVAVPIFRCVTQFSSRNILNEDLPFLRPICPNIKHLKLCNPIDNAGLAHLKGMRLQKLRLWGTQITDAGLAHLRGMPLQTLDLSGTQVTDAGLEHLRDMPLQTLHLSGTQVTDAGLVHLRSMPLQELDLSGTQVTDAGLAHLPDTLQELALTNTAVTDAGLAAHLRGKRLQTLDLDGTAVTDAGLEHLREMPLQVLGLIHTAVTDDGLRRANLQIPNIFR